MAVCRYDNQQEGTDHHGHRRSERACCRKENRSGHDKDTPADTSAERHGQETKRRIMLPGRALGTFWTERNRVRLSRKNLAKSRGKSETPCLRNFARTANRRALSNRRGKAACNKSHATVEFCPIRKKDRITFSRKTIGFKTNLKGLCCPLSRASLHHMQAGTSVRSTVDFMETGILLFARFTGGKMYGLSPITLFTA